MQDVARLQSLIAEYGQLRRQAGHTPQTRGQRFNEIIAEMLRCWGIEAQTSIRSHGEIDVVFSLAGTRYVVEAKWEQAKTSTGHIAKLQKRVRQRLAGTYGIFLSMSGYTAEALADVAYGERLEVLLLDGPHFEAMLAGLVPPQEMFSLVHDRAAFHAEPYTPLAKLLATTGQPTVDFSASASVPAGLTRHAIRGFAGDVLFSVADSNQLGLAAIHEDQLLVTTQHGIMAVDPAKRSTAWAVPVPGCHRNPLVDAHGAVLFTRRHGVGRYHNGDLTVVGGGLPGNTCLMRHPDGSAWVFSNGMPHSSTGASLTRLGDHLGDEQRLASDYPAAAGMNCGWLNEQDIVTVGSQGVSVSSAPAGGSRMLQIPQANPMGLIRLTPRSILTGGDSVTLLSTDLTTGQTFEVAQLNLQGSINELTLGPDGSVYIAAYVPSPDSRMPFVVSRLRAPIHIDPPGQYPAVAGLRVPASSAQIAPSGVSRAIFADASVRLPSLAPLPPQPVTTRHEANALGWQATRPDRGNPAGGYITFGGRSGIYWAIVGINSLLIALLAIVLLSPGPSATAKIFLGLAEAFLLAVTIGFGKVAAAPVRLEIGTQGIQVFARSSTSWFPWSIVDRVEVMRLEGGNLHIVAWCQGANTFPDFDTYGGGPRFLPRLGAVAICPVNVLRARRHMLVRALQAYGGNRVGTL